MVSKTTDYNDVRSSLRRHWDSLAIGFNYIAASTGWWVTRLEVQAGGAAGSGDAAVPAGYTGNKDDAMTSLNKGGFFSRDYPFVVTSIGVGLKDYPRGLLAGAAINGAINVTTGTVASTVLGYSINCEALAEKLWYAWAAWTECEYSEDGDKCSKFLGPVILTPGAFGTDNGVLPSNGVPMLGAEIKLRRGIVVPNGGPNATRNPIFKFLTKDANYVQFDPAFAAPTNLDQCWLDVLVTFCGYLAKDDSGMPLDVPEEGGTEKMIAENGGV
jgi:hypothetical protein